MLRSHWPGAKHAENSVLLPAFEVHRSSELEFKIICNLAKLATKNSSQHIHLDKMVSVEGRNSSLVRPLL